MHKKKYDSKCARVVYENLLNYQAAIYNLSTRHEWTSTIKLLRVIKTI